MKKNLLLILLLFPAIVFSQIVDSNLVKIDSLIAKIDTLKTSPKNSSILQNQKKIVIEGVIKDFTTAEPLSFATISFSHSSKGTRANIDGKFTFISNEGNLDTMIISSIGYGKKYILLDTSKEKSFYQIEMERSSIQMKNFVFKYDRNPGLTLIKKVIKNKYLNNYDKATNYSYEVYNKLEIDINKIPKKSFKENGILKNFNFVQNFIDSSSEEKPFLPLFLTETISDYYYQKKPKKTKEFIKGSRISGYKNESVSKMLGSMYQNINVYENAISIFNIDFISPIANDAPLFYKYEIVDTQIINNKTCYQVAFSPKRSGEHTFNGDCWIHDTDFAIQKINMIVTKEQNINWVNKVTMLQEFTNFEDTLWFLTKDKYFVDFLPPQGDKFAGFLGRKTTTYKNIKVNSSSIEDVVNDKENKDDTKIDKDALNRNENYWNEVRHDSLSKNEKAIYKMIDTIQNLPIYKKYYNGAYLLSTGIKEIGPVELGSFYNSYSNNIVEGSRFRFTIGTTPKLFKHIYLNGYLAYGTKDERFKYCGSALWILKRKPRMYVFAEVKQDLENNANSYDEARSIDNIFSSIGRKKNIPWKLAFVDKQRIEFFNSYYSGFSHLVSFERKTFTPYSPLPSTNILSEINEVNSNSIQTAEIGLELRFAYKEEFVEGNYYRTSLGTKYPLIKLYGGMGIKNLVGGQYNYQKIRLSISDNQSLKHFGSIYYNLFAGRIIGNVPYSILEVHPGNEFYYYNNRAFNMMYRYEYISDKYAGIILEHNMGSLFFKYIPYVDKMKIRCFWNAKTVYGGLSKSNQLLNLNKGYDFQTLSKSPYLEVGTGLENILKVLRIDFVWRVLPYRTPTNDSQIRRFGIFGSMKFSF